MPKHFDRDDEETTGEQSVRRRALIADSHEHFRGLLGACLQDAGFVVDAVADGPACLAWLDANATPDLLVVDEELPLLGGATVIARARTKPRLAGLPTVLLRAASSSAPLASASLPLVRVVTKPLTSRSLLLAVDSLLEDTQPTLAVSPVSGKQAVHFILGRGEDLSTLQRSLSAAAGHRPLVLVVDDDPSICDALTLILNEEGFDTLVAVDGNDALRVMSNGARPDLIVLDVMMPGMDGIQLAYRLRTNASHAQIPLLLFSANQQVAAMAREVGAVGHVKKPADLVALVGKIQDAISVPAD